MLGKVVEWLRAGYPKGVPEHDYQPLFALLRRRLSEDEVQQIADTLAENSDSASADAIASAISKFRHESAPDGDVNRVRACLAAGGWPLADPHTLREETG